MRNRFTSLASKLQLLNTAAHGLWTRWFPPSFNLLKWSPPWSATILNRVL